MKKIIAIAVTVVMAGLLLAGGASAWMGGCGMKCFSGDVEQMKTFQKDTLSVREEIMTKHIELRAEYQKATPDQNRVTALQKEIADLQAKMRDAATKAGLTVNCPMGGGMMGHGKMGCGKMGHGMMGKGMMGCGMGCGMMGQQGAGAQGAGTYPCPMAQ
jgi:zinc resistance-associated protein